MAALSSYTSIQILAWSKEEVAEKLESDIVFTSKYSAAFIENEIDGRELLDLKGEDLVDLRVTTLKHKKDILRWIEANTVKPMRCEVDAVPMVVPTVLPDLHVKRPQASVPSQIPRPQSCLPNVLSVKSDPGPSYERIFKPPKSSELSNETFHLWGKRYLLDYHPHQHKLYKNNEATVKSWFLDRSQPLVDSFFTGSFRHNPDLQKSLKDFIQARESELSSLIFDGGCSIIRWKVDDIYLFFLERKHYKNGKGAQLDAKRSMTKKVMIVKDQACTRRISAPMAVPQAPSLSLEDLEVLKLCSTNHSFHMIGLKSQTSTAKLAARDMVGNGSSELPNALAGTGGIGLSETCNQWGVDSAVTFGIGTPLKLLRFKPYKAWSVRIDALCEIDEAFKCWFVPCGQQFSNYNSTIGGLCVGQVIEIPIAYVTVQERKIELRSSNFEDNCLQSNFSGPSQCSPTTSPGQLDIFLDIQPIEPLKRRPCSEVKSSKRLQMKKLRASIDIGDDKPVLLNSQLPMNTKFSLEAKETIAMFTMDASCIDDVYAQLQNFMKDKNVVYKKGGGKGGVPFQKYTGLSKIEQLDLVVTYALKHVVKLVDLPNIRAHGFQDVFPQNIEFI